MRSYRKLSAISVAVVVGLMLGLYAKLVEPRRLEVTATSLRLKNWPIELDGALLALVADVHVGHRRGRFWSCPSLDKAIQAVAEAQPDLLLLGGDYGFWNWDPLHVSKVAARFKGTVRVAVLGNHDYARGRRAAAKIRAQLEADGVTVLANEAATVDVRGHDVVIAGLGDGTSKRDDYGSLLAALPESPAPVILLTHTPDAVDQAPPGRFHLALSGHTHGAQLAIPFLRRRILRRAAKTKYDHGLYEVNGIPLFITRGLGMVGHHARFRSRPEVSLLRLHSDWGSPQEKQELQRKGERGRMAAETQRGH